MQDQDLSKEIDKLKSNPSFENFDWSFKKTRLTNQLKDLIKTFDKYAQDLGNKTKEFSPKHAAALALGLSTLGAALLTLLERLDSKSL